MKSPYFQTNVGGGWGPPPGLGQLILQDQANARQGAQALGSLAGGLTSGLAGAVQGAADPGVTGHSTSAGGAFGGFLANFQASQGQGQNFKQLQQAGKTADSFREMIKSTQLTGPEQEPNVFGTDDEWKTLSATEKFARVAQAFQAQQLKGQQLAYVKGLQDYARTGQQMQEQTRLADVQTRFAKAYQAGNPDAVLGQLTPQNRFEWAVSQVPEALFNPNVDNAARVMQATAKGSEFTPQGGQTTIGNWTIPWMRTSPAQAQTYPELATDASGKTNPRFSHDAGGLAVKDRLNAALKTVDRITRIPESRRTEADRQDLDEARAIVRELQSGGSGGGEPAGGDNLWQQFLKTRK